MKSNVTYGLSRTQILVYSSLLIAISIVLKILFEVYIPLGGFPSLRINLNSIPIILGGIWLGPFSGFAIGVISDLLCYVVKPNGPLFLGFTLSSGLTGLIPGLLWRLFKGKDLRHFKWINLFFSLCAVVILFSSGTLSFGGFTLNYLGEPLNPFISVLFLLLILLFAVYPFVSSYILKKAEADQSESILVIITIEQIVNSVILNTVWLMILYGQAWSVLLPGRIIANIFLIPFYSVILSVLLKMIPKKYTIALKNGG